MAKILVADDNPHVLRMAEEALGTEGHDVSGVRDGSDVVELIAASKPDLVLLDTTLPGASAVDVCKAVAASSELAHTRVVMLAGPLESIDEADVAQAGAFAMLHKPLTGPALTGLVNGPEASASGDGKASDGPEPELIDTLVKGALDRSASGPTRAAIREHVAAVIADSMPAIIDRITDRLTARINDSNGASR